MSGGFNFTNSFGSFNSSGTLNVSTPLINVTSTTLSSVVLNVTTTQPPVLNATSQANILHCPEIGVKSGWFDERIQVSTRSRDVGTKVEISCKEGSKLRGPSTLRCLENGLWDNPQPHCEGISQIGIPMSTWLKIGVLSGCAGLVILVVAILLCRFLCCCSKSKDDSGSSGATITDSSDRESTSPYYDVSILNRNRSADTGSVHYAKPEVYSSFVNPGFYEDVYARWRSREELSERVYDTPWLVNRRLQDQCQSPELKWSTTSLQAHNNYDYGRFGRIPRAQVTEEEIQDSEALTTF